ncbi:hypothetical protein MMPV_004154 [Pyropia vietnamensis]
MGRPAVTSTANRTSTSRLIVKGLAPKTDTAALRVAFSRYGTLTDARVLATADGRSRQFGFVGFDNPAAAAAARAGLHRTYLGAAKLVVEYARAVGDDTIPRPWSRYSVGSSRYASEHGGRWGGDGGQGDEDNDDDGGGSGAGGPDASAGVGKTGQAGSATDAKLAEFKAVMQKRSRKPLWADGAVMAAAPGGRQGEGATKRKRAEVALVPSKKTGGEGVLLTRTHTRFGGGSDSDGDSGEDGDDDDDDDDDEYQDLPGAVGDTKPAPAAAAGDGDSDTESGGGVAADAAVSDADYLRSKMRPGVALSDSDDERADGGGSSSSSNNNNSSSSSDSSDSGSDSSDGETRDGEGGVRDDKQADVSGPAPPPSSAAPLLKASTATQDASTLRHYALAPGADAGETGRIFVRNLAFSVTEDDLDTLFSRYGTLAEVHLVVDPDTRRSRGIAYILYVLPECAVAALAALDGEIFAGRILHLLPAAGRPPPVEARRGSDSGGGASAYQAAAVSARIASAVAGTDVSAGRSALYVDAHAVARATAERLGVSTAEVLADDGYAAVRLAAGEARLQADARTALAAAGIDVTALSAGAGGGQAGGGGAGRGRRSRTTLLAKNLPAGTTAEALEGLFSPYGLLTGAVVAPGGVLAVVQFASAGDAKAAHAELAYSRIGDRPLYLEWAPAAAVVGFGVAAAKRSREEGGGTAATASEAPAKRARPSADGSGGTDVAMGAAAATAAGAADGTAAVEPAAAPAPGPSAPFLPAMSVSVFVKNLNFNTTDDALRAHFERRSRAEGPGDAHVVCTAMVARKRVAERGSKTAASPGAPRPSMGYGFVTFPDRAAAVAAVARLQRSRLDGHALELKLSTRGADAAAAAAASDLVAPAAGRGTAAAGGGGGAGSTKLVVKNVAFGATAKEIRALFASFASVKGVRLPRGGDGRAKGYAFVEFASASEAAAARTALADAHLYGRHLVLEPARDEATGASVDALQALASRKERRRGRPAAPAGGKEKATGEGSSSEEDEEADEHQMMLDSLYT